MKAMKAISLS